jgi:hypothetical protein
MEPASRDAIIQFMAAKKAGRSTGSKEMRYDPVTKKFVMVERGSAEMLPLVQDEDLIAFSGGAG